jgi:hypothetical protein
VSKYRIWELVPTARRREWPRHSYTMRILPSYQCPLHPFFLRVSVDLFKVWRLENYTAGDQLPVPVRSNILYFLTLRS